MLGSICDLVEDRKPSAVRVACPIGFKLRFGELHVGVTTGEDMLGKMMDENCGDDRLQGRIAVGDEVICSRAHY